MLRERVRHRMAHNTEVAMLIGKRGRQWPPCRGEGLTLHTVLTGDADDMAQYLDRVGRMGYLLASPVTRVVSPYSDMMERWEFWLMIPD